MADFSLSKSGKSAQKCPKKKLRALRPVKPFFLCGNVMSLERSELLFSDLIWFFFPTLFGDIPVSDGRKPSFEILQLLIFAYKTNEISTFSKSR